MQLQIIKRIFRRINSRYFKCKRILITISHKKYQNLDIDRWRKESSLFSSWNERTQILSNQIKPHSKVSEFGAAKLVSKDMLPDGCIYYNSNIKQMADELNMSLQIIGNWKQQTLYHFKK